MPAATPESVIDEVERRLREATDDPIPGAAEDAVQTALLHIDAYRSGLARKAEPAMCRCGCGKTRDDAVADVASRMLLNWEQASAVVARAEAEAMRRRAKEGSDR